jgi:hypothetical protein
VLSLANHLASELYKLTGPWMLLCASESDRKVQQDLCNSTQAILFLGTPHRGSAYAGVGETIRRIVSHAGFDTANQNIRALEIDGALLERCDERFQKLRNRCGFEIHTFQEARAMKGTQILSLNEKVATNYSGLSRNLSMLMDLGRPRLFVLIPS